jgi:anti-sigma regulatory factor (Ser/Thr protein kinase)
VALDRYWLPHTRKGPALARRHVRTVIAADPAAASADPIRTADAELVISELVTNALLHGSGPIHCALEVEDVVLRIEVGDGDPVGARVRARDLRHRDPTGRGLAIVDAIALDWGVRASPASKVVWAVVPLR